MNFLPLSRSVIILSVTILTITNLELAYGYTMLNPTQNSTEFIRASCNVTLYPNLCFKSLEHFANMVDSSSMNLAHAALAVSLVHLDQALAWPFEGRQLIWGSPELQDKHNQAGPVEEGRAFQRTLRPSTEPNSTRAVATGSSPPDPRKRNGFTAFSTASLFQRKILALSYPTGSKSSATLSTIIQDTHRAATISGTYRTTKPNQNQTV
ncbi:hypothetical protein EJ110_NYTH39471 [Nymphaea thermarum]|nr:hypothetical protein EJ110_NYTH39471 [Nymphaea thermarum]